MEGGLIEEPELRLLIDGFDGCAFFRVDPDGRISSWTRTAERLTGWPASEITGRHCACLYDDRDPYASALEDLRRALSEGRIQSGGWRVRRDGTRFWAQTLVAVLRDDGGRVRGFIHLIQDLTDLKQTEATLGHERAERERILAVLDQLPAGLLIAELPTARIVYTNQACLRITAAPPRPPARIGEHGSWRVLHLDGTPYRHAELPLVRAMDHGEQVWREDLLIERLDGRRRMVRVNAGPVRDPRGRIRAAVAMFVDLTDERTRPAESADARFRELFIGMLGHDLRGPLTAIRMAGEMLLRHGIGSPQRDLVGRILGSVRRMAHMIDQVLDLTRVRLAGGIQIVRRRVDLVALLRRVAQELELVHPGREVRLALPPSAEGEWDEARLERVAANLVGNALEHGDPHRPVLVELRDRGDQVVLAVENEGPTIPPEMLPTLFDPFRRAAERREGGLGLGLYIARQILEAHGGSLEIRSAAGKTEVTARVPR